MINIYLFHCISRLEAANCKAAVLRIAEPIKYYWAQKHSLDFEKLLDTSEYKEQHRLKMVEWSMEVRANSYGYFNKEAIKMAKGLIKINAISSGKSGIHEYD